MTPETKIANLQISSDKHMWKLLGPGMYNARPLFPVTVRELLQNSVDAQRARGINTPVQFSIENNNDGSFILRCQDAGIGMDVSTIHDKFLVLGESGKAEGVGGFGVAKASILGACSSWELITQDNFLSSDMLGLAPITKKEHQDGCAIALKYDKNEGEALMPTSWSIRAALEYLATSSASSVVTMKGYDGIATVTEIKGLKVDENRLVASCVEGGTTLKMYIVPTVTISPYTDFGYSRDAQHTLRGKIIYRLNGLTQFISYSHNANANFNAVVEVTTTARPRDLDYPFTVSREEMVCAFSDIVSKNLRSLFVNNLTTEIMLKEKTGAKTVRKTYYDGSLCESYGKINRKAKRAAQKEQQLERECQKQGEAISGAVLKFVDELSAEKQGEVKNILEKNLERSPLGIKALVKASSEHKHIKHMTTRNIKVLQTWITLIGMIMDANPSYQHPFGVGLILDDDFCAERYSEGGSVYYLVNTTRYKVSKPMDTALSMLLDACHEVTHTVWSNHSEDFTVSENKVREKFIAKYGMNALYSLARQLRGGGKQTSEDTL